MAITKLRAIFKGRKQQENDVNDELRFHLERQVELNIAAGMSPEEARRRALIAFGGIQQTRESLREVHRGRFFESLASGLALCLAHAAQIAGLYHHCSGYSGAGDRRQHSDLQLD